MGFQDVVNNKISERKRHIFSSVIVSSNWKRGIDLVKAILFVTPSYKKKSCLQTS